MKPAIITLILYFLCTSMGASSKLSKEACTNIVKDLQRVSNISPQEVEEKAPDALNQLRNGETLTSYFIAFDIYAENLFNKGKTKRAQEEIEKMLEEAFDQKNEECRVIALRTQGTFYYKLGLYERASDCFRNAMKACPNYDSKLLEQCFTWSSTLFWLVQSDIRIGRMEEAEYWLQQMDKMMMWLEKTNNHDDIGYKPVMIRGLKAKIDLQRGNLDAASELLQQCQKFMRPEVPSRAYVEYYVAKMQLSVKENKHQEALQLLNELIEMHIDDYKPIAAEFIYQKGLSLKELGKFEESTSAFIQYIELKQQADKVALARLLDEMTTQYKVNELQHERDKMQRHLFFMLMCCLALAIIIGLIVVTHRRIRSKNKTMARHISEMSKLLRESQATQNNDQNTAAESSSAELIDIGNKAVNYIIQTQCYLNVDCSKEMVKDGIGVAERTLAKAITAVTGHSFVNYINRLRLNESIEMLEDKPEMNINDISTACGFGTVRQFQRIFKQHYDMTPSAYRNAYKDSSSNPI